MTPKSLIAIDLKELTALEIRCSNCGAVLAIPVIRENIRAAQPCPGCNVQLWDQEDSLLYNTLVNLVASLSSWQRRDEKRFTLGFSLPTESTPPHPKSK